MFYVVCQTGNAVKNALRNCLNDPSPPPFAAMGLEYFSITYRSCLFKTSSINDSIRALFFDIDKTVILQEKFVFVGNDHVGLLLLLLLLFSSSSFIAFFFFFFFFFLFIICRNSIHVFIIF